INCDLLEMEVAADKQQIQKMMQVVREAEITPIQRFSESPVSGDEPDGRAATIVRYRKKLDEACAHFVIKSKDLSRERRRVTELEDRLGLGAAASAGPSSPVLARGGRSWDDAGRALDLILRGVESWQRGNPAAEQDRREPAPPSAERSWRDPERLLGLLRK